MLWTVIGERVTVIVAGPDLRAQDAGQDVARYAVRSGRHGLVVDPAHFADIGRRRANCPTPEVPTLLRPLCEYDAVAGGAW